MESLDAYVAAADGKQVKVCSTNGFLDGQLGSLGFAFDSTLQMHVKDVADMAEKARIFSDLRDAGVCFSDGKEWCPSELFEYFREQSLLRGKFKRVSWKNPQTFSIKEV